MFPTQTSRFRGRGYQVKPEDRDLLTLSANLNLPYDALTAANPNINSISTGQFINLPTPGGYGIVQNGAVFGADIGTSPNMTPKIPAPVLSQPNLAQLPPQDIARRFGANVPIGSPAPSSQRAGETQRAGEKLDFANAPLSVRLQTLAEQNRLSTLQNSFLTAQSPDQLPDNVPSADIGKLGYTPEQMRAAGYVFYRGTYKKQTTAGGVTGQAQPGVGGTAATATVAAATNAPLGSADYAQTKAAQYYAQNNIAFTNQLRWDPERKKYVKIGQLIREGRLNVRTGKLKGSKKGVSNASVAAVTPTPEIRADTPSTTLDIILGS